MPDMRYAAGMDGGGTKTVLEARAPDGRVLLRERFGPLNLNSAAAQAVRETMQGCTDALARLPGGLEACAALCVGSAGVSNPQARALLEQMLRRCGYRGALLLTGDQETALAGALGAPCGMVLIAGTGSICFGRDAAGKTARSGGYGHKIDDEGSGYALGRDALAAVVRAQDGRGPRTLLTDLVFAQLKVVDVGGLVQFTYDPQTDKKQIAALAPLVARAYEAGDEAAKTVVEKACRELALLVEPRSAYGGRGAGADGQHSAAGQSGARGYGGAASDAISGHAAGGTQKRRRRRRSASGAGNIEYRKRRK